MQNCTHSRTIWRTFELIIFMEAKSASIANSNFIAFYELQANWQQQQRRKGDSASTFMRIFLTEWFHAFHSIHDSYRIIIVVPTHFYFSIHCANAFHTICFYRHHNLLHRNLSKHFMMQIARMLSETKYVDEFSFYSTSDCTVIS